ncbi:MAG: helix-turn-helix domain-containing protein [Bacteroidales bacterium]|nr:helix-turn-helix domain-containing protein [Bacteroidales bacterium]
MIEEISLNQRVDQFFKTKDISQQQIAKRLGVSRQAVNNWFSGNHPIPSRHLIKMLSDFEKLNPQWLLNGVGEMEGNEQSLPLESLVLTRKEITIELMTAQIREKDALISELQKEIGRMDERLKQFSK